MRNGEPELQPVLLLLRCGVDTGESMTDTSIFNPTTAARRRETPTSAEAHRSAIDALPPGSALLVVKRGPNAGSRFLLDRDVTTAGRHPDSDIFLDDVTVSRQSCRVPPRERWLRCVT